MKSWKTVALSVSLAGFAGLAATDAPVHGQTRAPRATTPRVAELLSVGSGGRIGVAIRDVDASDAKEKSASGVIVDSVDADSPAEKAGLKAGDVVVEFDGERVRSVRQFTRLVTETPGGRSVQAGVMRNGARVNVTITPRDGNSTRFLEATLEPFEMLRHYTTTPTPVRPAIPRATPMTPLPPAFDGFIWRGGNRLGITAGELSSQLAEYFGTKDGVLVSAVESNSAAAKAGLKAGDVITSVNSDNVDSPAELRRLLGRVEAGGEFTLGIVRDRKTMTLKGRIDGVTERRRTIL